VAVLGLAGGLPAQTLAQQTGDVAPAATGPTRLGPPTLLAPRDPTGAGETGVTTLGRRSDDDASRSVRGIQVNPLAEIDPESIGILDSQSGGFGRNMWRGSKRAAIERLLPRLPGAMASATMRSLARRLLLTNAPPPRQRAGGAGSESVNLLSVRVDRLAMLGDVAGVNDLLRVVPQHHDDEAIARARVEGQLLAGDPAGACRNVRREIAERHGTPYWRKALVFCQILSGEVDQAMLGVGLMREQGISDDPAFFSLVDAFTGGNVARVPVASALHFAMLDAVGQAFPDDLLADASPGLLVGLARWPGADLAQRTAAGERAVALGVLEPEMLAGLYAEMTFTPEDLADAVAVAGAREGPVSRALLYQAAQRRELHSARAELLRAALASAREDGLYPMATQVFLPLLSAVPPRPELVWFAETAGRALYATGRYDRAGEWFTLARQETILNPQAAAAVAVLWPYSRLAAVPALAWESDLSAWRTARQDDSAAERERQALLRGAFMALGEQDSLSWIELATEPTGAAGLVAKPGTSTRPLPNAALLYALKEASEMRRLGESVLLVLLVLGAEGPAQSHPMALNAALSGLMQVGLEREARALAIEAAIAKGV
jgi:tetratricopeptide (TPR) repeat protein